MGGYKRLAVLVLIAIGASSIVGGLAGRQVRAETMEVVAAVARDFYPEYTVDAEGRPAGFAIDMMNAVGKRAGLSVTYRVVETWADLLAALERGDADLVPIVAVTRARQEAMLFTRPAVASLVSMFVRQDADDLRHLSGLTGRKVAVIEGGFSAGMLSERHPGARLVPYKALTHAVFDLLSGEVDALVSFESSVWKVAERARVADRIKAVGEPLPEAQRAIAVRKDLPALRDRLDAVLAEFLNSGEYSKLNTAWYAAAPPFWDLGRIGWLAGASTALLLFGMLVWQSLSLRTESRPAGGGSAGTLPGERAVALPAPAISRACGGIALALGAAGLFGWAFDVAALKTVLPGLVAMQPWTAISIGVAGTALLAATVPGRAWARASITAAVAVLIIGLQMLVQNVTGLDFGTDRWLFPEAVGTQPGHPHPGRVATATSAAFVLLGAMLLLARAEKRELQVAFSIVGTLGMLLMAAPLLGYLIGAGTLRSVASFTPVAMHVALGLVVLFLGVLALRPDTGWMALLSGDTPGATSARALLPVGVAGPILLAWLFTSGKQAGLYAADFQVGLITLATIVLLANALLWNAARLDRLHRARLAAAEALRRSEERYRTLVEGQPDPICQFRPDTTLTFVNRAYAEFYGREPEDLVGQRWLDFAPSDERPRFLEELTSFTPEHPERHEETRSTRADHEVRWHLCHTYGLFDDAGRIVSFQTFGTDITARKRAEDALRESETRYRTVGEAVPYGVWVCNAEGGVEYVSRSFLDLIGKTLDEVKPRGWLDRLPPEDVKPTLDAWRACVRAGGDWTWEHRIKGKDGAWRTILSLGRPVRDEHGRITSWGGFNLDISERKRAEEDLRESEAQLRRTVENAPFPIIVHAEDGEVVQLSRAWVEMTGYAPEEIPTVADWARRAYGEREEVVRAEIDELYALDRAVDEGEFTIRTADGRRRVWAFSTAPLGRDSRGRRLVVSMAADVTERKAAERALRESELRMRALLDASQDEILLVSVEGEVLAINKAAARRLARRTGGADPLGTHLDRLLPEDQVEQRMAIVRQVAGTARLAHWEAQIGPRWFEFWFYPVLRPDEPVSEVAVYAREITQQKQAQADLGKLFQAVQQSPMSVVITDRQGVIEYVNPEFTKVTGYTAAEAIGQTPHILRSGHTPREHYDDLWKTISGGGVWHGEFLNKKKSGELFWEIASIAPVKKDDCRITNFVAVKEDITQRKEIEEQLRQSQKMQAVGQLTGGIAHDFNNLLAIIIGNLQLLAERLSGDARAQEFLDDALWSARRGGELTHRLLAFARKQPLKPAVIDLNDVVRGMTELLRRTLGAGIRIEESLARDLWKAFADRGELERALVNLAVNARDAMRSAGTLSLETRNAVLDDYYVEQYEEVTPGEYVLLAVTDSGTGMPAEVVQRVFEPFFTTKEVGQGSGLGLSMVYGFVKQTGGHISIYSRVGQGTCVKLYLPRASLPPARLEEDPPDAPATALGEKVVLVVEDEVKLRKVAVRMLERLGLQSMQAETAKDALDLLAGSHADVLFTDIELPGGMNGTELAEWRTTCIRSLKCSSPRATRGKRRCMSGACMNKPRGCSNPIRTRSSAVS